MYRPCYFFFNDTATTEIYTLSLHDALPIFQIVGPVEGEPPHVGRLDADRRPAGTAVETAEGALLVPCLQKDRKSTRLNSSHANISYAVFCLKKKTNC